MSEDTWWASTWKTSGHNLKDIALYFGSISVLTVAWNALPSHNLVFLGFGFVPVICVFFFRTLPLIQDRKNREWREKLAIDGIPIRDHYFRIGPWPEPGVEGKTESYDRPDHAHLEILNWIYQRPVPLLHLTGFSGTGKTSLINAFVIPQLRKPAQNCEVIRLRSFEDPLSSLRLQLAAFGGGILHAVPEDSFALLRAIADILGKNNRKLVVIFDQFEEFFILHATIKTGGDVANDMMLKKMRDFLNAFVNESPSNVTILLSYRFDHQRSIASLGLPPLTQDGNWKNILPFSAAQARAFLLKSGLKIPAERLDRVLTEAAQVEETRQHIRPIVLNLLGRVLEEMAEQPRAYQPEGSLLRSYVERHMHDPRLGGLAPQLMQKMISRSATIQPRTVSDLAHPDLGVLDVEGVLIQLGEPGLVRCLVHDATEPAQRVYEISHDFVARIVAVTFEDARNVAWKVIRPWIAPVALLLWITAVAGYWWNLDKTHHLGYLAIENQRQVRKLARSPGESAKIFDAGSDFSIQNGNPNGAWSYTWSVARDSAQTFYQTNYENKTSKKLYVNMQWPPAQAIPAVVCAFTNDWSGAWPPHTFGLHPGLFDKKYSHIFWTAPDTASYSISCAFTLLDVGEPHVYVLKKSQESAGSLPLSDKLLTDSDPALHFSTTQTFNAGERIDFCIGYDDSGPDSESTAFAAVIVEHK
jgi:hypothetical protein